MARGEINVGIAGTGWIVRAHVLALHTLNHLQPLPCRINVRVVYGRREESVSAVARELGIARWTTSWEQLASDPEIEVIGNAGPPPVHAPISITALKAGKHVLCEKPLAATAEEAREMLRVASGARGISACGFNYRFVPAVRLLHQLLAGGRLGAIRHFRGLYLQDWLSNNPSLTGHSGGSVLDFCHLFDMLRHLAGEPRSVAAVTTSFLSQTDDSFIAALDLDGTATASLEASSCATGWKGRQRIEVNGTEGSAWWDMEDFNRLHVMFVNDQREGVGGFRDVLVTEWSHPFMAQWWPAGHVIGWQSTFVHQWRAFLQSVLDGQPSDPLQATFRDGLRATELALAVRRSAREGRRVDCAPPLAPPSPLSRLPGDP
jgi:predicted dehydrogenase